MVNLIDKSTIYSINIDTVERAIVFAVTVLRTSIVGVDSTTNNLRDIRITQSINQNGSFIIIEANIPYNSYFYNLYGGNLLNFIQPITTATINIESIPYILNISETQNPSIPDYDSDVIDTFEKYLIHYSFILQASLENKNDFIDIKILDENNNGSQIKIKYTLPFDYNKWLLGNNYVGTVNRVVTTNYNTDRNDLFIPGNNNNDDNINNNVLDNNNLLNNNKLLTN